jgi:hypothetical protein
MRLAKLVKLHSSWPRQITHAGKIMEEPFFPKPACMLKAHGQADYPHLYRSLLLLRSRHRRLLPRAGACGLSEPFLILELIRRRESPGMVTVTVMVTAADSQVTVCVTVCVCNSMHSPTQTHRVFKFCFQASLPHDLFAVDVNLTFMLTT